jgi:hypothetical protein
MHRASVYERVDFVSASECVFFREACNGVVCRPLIQSSLARVAAVRLDLMCSFLCTAINLNEALHSGALRYCHFVSMCDRVLQSFSHPKQRSKQCWHRRGLSFDARGPTYPGSVGIKSFNFASVVDPRGWFAMWVDWGANP